MNVERLIEALHGAETDLHVEDILDAFWLATRNKTLSLHAVPLTVPRSSREPPPLIEEPPTIVSPAEIPAESAPSSEEQIPLESEETEPVYASGGASPTDSTVKASPVALPAGHALTGRLPLSRALRPFRQRWLSRHQEELDEERTAEVTAELHGQLHPVFCPLQERWFDADVVLEDDPAIGLWRDTLRDFSQMLRDTGAFRDVRSWRLRMPAGTTASPATRKQSPALETPTGGRTPARALGGQGVRRLVFFATHGSSERWLDGSYARLIAPWLHGSSVVLLHLFDREHWKRGALGDPHGLCYAQEPGAVTSTLRVERFWWALASDKQNAIRVPAVPLTPSGFSEWSHMQMARGRRCPVFLLDPDLPPMEETAPPPEREFERAVALLREVSPDAFRLAVYLSAGAFTIPVARLVQEAKFGAVAQQQHLAEVLLSGLVFARSPQEANADPNELYYEFHPKARAILMRSLRDADAELIAGALERRVSQYIKEISGRAITFRALVADEKGKYDLPQWAQPFARLGLSLLGTSVQGKTVAQLLEEFRRSNPPAVVVRTAQLAVATPTGGMLAPNAMDRELWNAILGARLVRQNANGRWNFLAGLEPLLERIASTEPLQGLVMLWVDDQPANNANETAHFLAVGAAVDAVQDTEQALRALEAKRYDVIISDMARRSGAEAGFDLLRQLRARSVKAPVIIYAAGFAADAARRERALRAGAFGCTNNPPELLELILDAVGRSARPQNLTARESRLIEALRSIGIDRERGLQWLNETPDRMGLQILAAQADRQVAFQNHLKVIQAYAASGVNHLILVRDNELQVVAAVIDPDKSASRYTLAGWEGVIGRAAKHGEVVWVPDVSRDPEYIRAEPGTCSELALPLFYQGESSVVGVVNIEMDEVDALTESDVRWLVEFCAPLGPRLRVARGSDAAVDESTEQPESAEEPRIRSGQPPKVRSMTGTDDYALVVGIGQYTLAEIAKIVDAETNARLFYDWLLAPEGGGVPPSNAMLLLSTTATQMAFEYAIESVLRRSAAGRRLYLYFAGHVLADRDDLSLLASDYAPMEPRRAIGIRQYLETIRRGGNLDELVIIVDAPISSRPDWIASTLQPIAGGASPSGSPASSFFACRTAQATEQDQGLTSVVVQGLRGAAANDDAGEITNRSLMQFLDRMPRNTVDVYISGDIIFRPRHALVRVLAYIPAPAGVVRVVDSMGKMISEERLSEGSCHFRLAEGKYRAEHAESGIAVGFEVGPGMDFVEVWLRAPSTETDPNTMGVPSGSPLITTKDPKSLTKKRIVLAFDGPWSTEQKGEDNAPRTNVQRFLDSVAEVAPDGRRQMQFYAPGVSTTWLNRLVGGAFGKAIADDIQSGYRYLVKAYEDGDDIVVLGFSRGAYLARSLVALIRKCGILSLADPKLLEQAYELFRDKKLRDAPDHVQAVAFRSSNSREARVLFLGVWDTVGALGIPSGTPNAARFQFHDTQLSKIVNNAFHALAIDEFREAFRPSLWSAPNPVHGQRMEQRWFIGSHADVGGGYAEHDLSDISLRWMQERAMESGLALYPANVAQSEGKHRGVIHDSFNKFLPDSQRHYRRIGVTRDSYETVDPSALKRFDEDPSYRPANLLEYLSRTRPPVKD